MFPVCLQAGPKIDTLYLQAGDRLTGEVKNLEDNRLEISTDDAGTLFVEWNKLDSIHILSSMRIVLDDGAILYGVMLPCGRHKITEIWHREGDPILIELDRIVALTPIRERIRDRLDGHLTTGISYVKANDLFRFDFDGLVSYTADRNNVSLSYVALYSQDQDGPAQRQNIELSFRRLLPRRWFLITKFYVESNSELGLDIRSNLATGGGSSLIRSNSMHLYWMGGFLGNRESSGDVSRNNVEGFGAIYYHLFIYDNPDVTLHLFTNVIPSLTSPGRFRFNIESSLSWEFVTDFYLKWGFYYAFDNQPLEETADRSDWAVSLLGLQYEF